MKEQLNGHLRLVSQCMSVTTHKGQSGYQVISRNAHDPCHLSFMVSLEDSASVWRRHQDQLRKRLVKHTPVDGVDDPDLPLPPMTVEKAPPTLPSVPSPVPESTTGSESNSSHLQDRLHRYQTLTTLQRH